MNPLLKMLLKQMESHAVNIEYHVKTTVEMAPEHMSKVIKAFDHYHEGLREVTDILKELM